VSSRYDIREEQPTDDEQSLGVTGTVFVVWDKRWNVAVHRGRYATHGQAKSRISRMEQP
jgi:hypothetical protein